jgi:hypothetical protein
MMQTLALMADAVLLMNKFFEPVSVADQIRNTPMLIYAVFLFSLAAAYFALWGTAPDFRVFRNMGAYLLLTGVQVLFFYLGGNNFQWALIAWTSPLLVMVAGEAMRVPHRRWALLIWPLGLAAETTYAESTFRLGAGQQLTLVTDGVVEARDKTGALFGFERTAAIANQPAEAIASAAQAFGQDDDITALTMARTA